LPNNPGHSLPGSIFEDSSEILWEYDLEGKVTKVTDPEGEVTEYTYFRDGLLKEVILKRPPASDRVFTYAYDDAGRLLSITIPAAPVWWPRLTTAPTPTPAGTPKGSCCTCAT
jgi:YD repeat-containing protein